MGCLGALPAKETHAIYGQNVGNGSGSSANLYPAPPREGSRSLVLALSTVSVVAVAAAVIVVALLAMYLLPRGGRRRRP